MSTPPRPPRSGRPRWSRRRKLIALLTTPILLLVALLGGTYAWIRLAAHGRMYAVADAPPRDVALVLGAGLRPDGTPTPYLAARLDIARDLYARGTVKAILVSGDNRTEQYDEPTSMRRYLIDKGVPGDVIVADFAGLDTYDSCYRAQEIFGVRSTIVVSQSYHVPRALAVCRAIGLDAIGVGDDTGRVHEATWAAGEQREVAAGVKAAWDVLVRRTPILGQRERSVQDILDRAR